MWHVACCAGDGEGLGPGGGVDVLDDQERP